MIDISKVAVHGPHIGSYRTTKYELRFIHVGPNGLGLECAERGVPGSTTVRLVVDEDVYTREQIATIQDAMSLIEEGFRAVHDAKEDELKLKGIDIPRAEVHKLVAAAEQAKVAAAVATAEKARLDEEAGLARDLAEVERKRLEIERAELEGQIAAKRVELAAAQRDAVEASDAKNIAKEKTS